MLHLALDFGFHTPACLPPLVHSLLDFFKFSLLLELTVLFLPPKVFELLFFELVRRVVIEVGGAAVEPVNAVILYLLRFFTFRCVVAREGVTHARTLCLFEDFGAVGSTVGHRGLVGCAGTYLLWYVVDAAKVSGHETLSLARITACQSLHVDSRVLLANLLDSFVQLRKFLSLEIPDSYASRWNFGVL